MLPNLDVVARLISVHRFRPRIPIAIHLMGKAQHYRLAPGSKGLAPLTVAAIKVAGGDSVKGICGLLNAAAPNPRLPRNQRNGSAGAHRVQLRQWRRLKKVFVDEDHGRALARQCRYFVEFRGSQRSARSGHSKAQGVRADVRPLGRRGGLHNERSGSFDGRRLGCDHDGAAGLSRDGDAGTECARCCGFERKVSGTHDHRPGC